jgi:hypothetical protein
MPTVVTAVDAGPLSPGEQTPSLPNQYLALYKLLIERPEWPLADAEALAREHGLMLNGAIEAINDWSFDVHGAALFVEESDRVTVETALLH